MASVLVVNYLYRKTNNVHGTVAILHIPGIVPGISHDLTPSWGRRLNCFGLRGVSEEEPEVVGFCEAGNNGEVL